MARSKIRKKAKKKPINRLVMRFDANTGLKYISHEMGQGCHRWLGILDLGQEDGIHNEFDVSPSGPIALADYIRMIRTDVNHIIGHAVTSYELKVYRRA